MKCTERAVSAFRSGVEPLVDSAAGIALATKKGFSRGGLTVHGKLAAMAHGDGLLLKLPKSRASDLVAAGAAVRFDAGKGRPMREWVVVSSAKSEDWQTLAKEAVHFVSPGGL